MTNSPPSPVAHAACPASGLGPRASRELGVLATFIACFLALYFLPVGTVPLPPALHEGMLLTQWYAREHVLLCLLPALFIAGAISTFLSQASVMRYLGPRANRVVAYSVASVAGTILAVCSCTVLPLFGGIWMRGAGLGPAITFLYSGPAISVLAIAMTARVLGLELGLARTIGAIGFSVVAGLAMHLAFRHEERARADAVADGLPPEAGRPFWQNGLLLLALVGVLVFANWSPPAETVGVWATLHAWKWQLTGASALLLSVTLGQWFGFGWRPLALAALPVAALAALVPQSPLLTFVAGCAALVGLCAQHPDEGRGWLDATWNLAKPILPLLIGGVFLSGVLLGRPGQEGLIPSRWISESVGGNSLAANLAAAVVGAFMYFATLTEVPILQGLLGSGMGKGPALALLLAGPALSLPSMLVLRSLMGTRKTVVYIGLVIAMATLSGLVFGTWF